MLSLRYGIYAVKLDPDSFSGTPVYINGIMEHPLRYGATVEGEPTSGDVFPHFKSTSGYRRGCTFRSKHVRDGLANAGLLGLAITSATYTGLTFYGRKRAQGSTRASGSVNRSYNFSDGIIVPSRLSVSHQRDAEITYEGFFISPDGSADPLTVAASVADPTTLTDAARMTLGPVTVAGTLLTGIEGFDVDFNVDVPVEGSDGDLFDTLASIENCDPVITIRGLDESVVDTITKSGVACTQANTKLFLKQRADGGTYTADGSSVHTKLACAGICQVEESLAGSPRVGTTLKIYTVHDDTNNPIVITNDTPIA